MKTDLMTLNEAELTMFFENMDDKLMYKSLTIDEVVNFIEGVLELDFLSFSYETRELILNTLCNANVKYLLAPHISWSKINSIRNLVEDDLIEYIDELVDTESML